MGKKIRKVEIFQPKIDPRVGDQNVLFEDVLLFLNGKEFPFGDKWFLVSLFDDRVNDNCIEGLIITTQDSDIPPKRDKRTGNFSPVEIDIRREGFAYANVFLYDKQRNVFIYEINKNGCYIKQLINMIQALWNHVDNDRGERTIINIDFKPFARRDEYNRMLRMTYYKKLSIDLVNPEGLVNAILDEEDSLENLIKSSINSGVINNANVIKIEQTVLSRSLNPAGLSGNIVRGLIDKVLNKVGRNNIMKLEVCGYTEDIEESKRCRAVDLLVDTFDESFRINDIQIHADLQRQERKNGIESVYNKIIHEIREIIGF